MQAAGDGADQRVVFRLERCRILDEDGVDDVFVSEHGPLVEDVVALRTRQHCPVLAGLAVGYFFTRLGAGLFILNEAIGRIVAVHNFGAGDIIEIAPAKGGETLMLPFTNAVVPTVDMAAGSVTIVPPGEVEARDDPDA